jgi:hypothetical protein
MAQCRFCDQKNASGRTHCEKCGAELPRDFDAPPPEPRPAPAPASGVKLPADLSDFERQIATVAAKQGKIAAIMVYRTQHKVGLKEAKDAVEAIIARSGVNPAEGQGCAKSAAMFVLLVLAGGLLLSRLAHGVEGARVPAPRYVVSDDTTGH